MKKITISVAALAASALFSGAASAEEFRCTTTVGAQSADQKLATFLLAFADYGASEDGEFDLPVRRGDIGEFLGLRLETVSRKLSEFQRRKWVRMVSLYRCVILDREALEGLAEGGEPGEVGYARARH